MSTIKNTSSLQSQQDSISNLPPPPSYDFDEERNGSTFQDGKRLRAICSDSNQLHHHQNVKGPAPNQAVFQQQEEEAFYESKPYHQRRVYCLSLFWFAVICDICATGVALIGTLGATLTCRSGCVDDCNAICNPKSEKGLIASIVIFVLFSGAIIVGKLACCCCHRRNT